MATINQSALSFLALALAGSTLSARGPETVDLPQRTRLAVEQMQALRPTLNLDEQHAFQVRSTHEDELGQTHVRFNQLFQGVRVWEGESILHVDGEGRELGRTLATHDRINVSTRPSLEAAEVLGIVHQDLNPSEAYAQEPSIELVVFPHAVETPRPRLRRVDDEAGASDFVRQVTHYTLAYHVHAEIESEEVTAHTDYILDAHTGGILKKWSTLHTAGATGTANRNTAEP